MSVMSSAVQSWRPSRECRGFRRNDETFSSSLSFLDASTHFALHNSGLSFKSGPFGPQLPQKLVK
jgi:hypothetical protein